MPHKQKINDLFIKYRKELLPQLTKNLHKLLKEDQQSLGNVNELFCGLHFLVGLALGLIEKLVTGPLRSIMNKEKCVLSMSKQYQNLLECFENG